MTKTPIWLEEDHIVNVKSIHQIKPLTSTNSMASCMHETEATEVQNIIYLPYSWLLIVNQWAYSLSDVISGENVTVILM